MIKIRNYTEGTCETVLDAAERLFFFNIKDVVSRIAWLSCFSKEHDGKVQSYLKSADAGQ